MSRGSRGEILVVDDEPDARSALAAVLESHGFRVATAADAFRALAKLDELTPELVISDLRMPGLDGLELLARVRQLPTPPAFIMVSGQGDIPSAVRALREGATHYLVKPVDPDELHVVIARQLEVHRAYAALQHHRVEPPDSAMLGTSPAIRRVYDVVSRIASSSATVLITGESGTGKELVASAIHAASPRRQGPLVKVHCAALAETVLESELFGHERGAFTGAVSRRQGRFALADGGTLFLDEIGELTPSTQVKLLRFLQEREFEPVGSTETQRVDVRVVAATNRDLVAMAKAATFREDLFHRLNVVTVEIPPLRERRDDVPTLAGYFLAQSAQANQARREGFTDEAVEALLAHNWPGNVRELANTVERAVLLSRGPLIEVHDLPPLLRRSVVEEAEARIPGSTLRAIERHAILKTLESVGGSTAKAAGVLGVTPRMIHYRLQEYRRAAKLNIPAVAPKNDPES